MPKVLIEKLDDYGRGITHINNKVVFVENALPHEEVEIQITSDHKKYDEAKVRTLMNVEAVTCFI